MRASIFISAALASTALCAAPALAKTTLSPYLEVDQSITAPLSGGGEVLTYSTVAAGVDVNATTNRMNAQLNFRIERNIGWNKGTASDTTLSGLARVEYKLTHSLSIDAGALATRTRTDSRGAAIPSALGSNENLSQVYSVYAGPSLNTHVGALNVSAAYHIGYTKISDTTPATLGIGQPPLETFDHSTTQVATASVGMATGHLPFGWTVNGAYARDDANRFSQTLVKKHIRGDVVVPVRPTIALVGGVGYEQVKASERGAIFDPVSGQYQTDPTSPKLPYADISGLYWDAGVLWKPSRMTTLEARIGKRYGSTSITGSFSSQLSEATAVKIGVYDEVDTFGSQLNNGLAALPTGFQTTLNPFNSQFSSCVYGTNSTTGNTNAGGCLNALGSISGSVYRSRGIVMVLSSHHGPWGYGVAAGYDRRTFLTPTTGVLASLNGNVDQSAFVQGSLTRRLTPMSEFEANVYANWFQSGVSGAPSVTSFGASGTYLRNFGNHLSGQASLGLFSSDVQGIQDSVTAAAKLGMRYRF